MAPPIQISRKICGSRPGDKGVVPTFLSVQVHKKTKTNRFFTLLNKGGKDGGEWGELKSKEFVGKKTESAVYPKKFVTGGEPS